MKKKFGIMQGRLLPKYEGRYQAHPIGIWESEFPVASKLGLDSIEFIFDPNIKTELTIMPKETGKDFQDHIKSLNMVLT